MRVSVESPASSRSAAGGISSVANLPNMDSLGDKDLAALRNLLLSRERAQIKKILQRLDDPATRAQELARILPAALALHSAQDATLEQALLPSVRGALGDALKERPELLLRAVRGAMLDLVFTPWRAVGRKIRRWRKRKSVGRNIPTQIERLYLVRRSDHALLEQIVRPSPSLPDDDGQCAEEERSLSSMVPYLLSFLRDEQCLDRYALMGHLRIEHFTYGIHVSKHLLLLSVIRSPVAVLPVNELAECGATLARIEREQADHLEGRSVTRVLPKLGETTSGA